MLTELPEAYAALAAGRAPKLPALETSYVDFAFWQRARLEDDGALAPQARNSAVHICISKSNFRAASCVPLPYVFMWASSSCANAACSQCLG